VFGDSERALKWLSEANPALDNQAPIHALQSDAGRNEVLNILGRIEHGVIS
jgi:putative toxin-antitoxin system antitoxin component (TIGR02293 family)